MLLFPISFSGAVQDAPQFYTGSDLQQRVMRQTGVHLVELVDAEDQRAGQCPAGQRILRVAGTRDQVGNHIFTRLGLKADSKCACACARTTRGNMSSYHTSSLKGFGWALILCSLLREKVSWL